ncbi:MAG: class I SAM-dependent methyltransferase [Lachnospiraceae bacterium]|nr:class I SAM-dependent methyltransferase [Lachnospiraceae bacterium]
MNKSWGVKVMENMRLLEIREAEKKSHMEMYSGAELFELGSWLQKPVKTVLDLFPLFTEHKELRVLDLGCGVGRNSIPIAKEFHTIPVTLECVDILELAIDKLYMNARQHDVEDNIKGIVSAIEDYPIVADGYDMIMAISALEHIDSKESFENKLFEIRNGLRNKGVVCLILNSNVEEYDKESGEKLSPQFEVNLPTECLELLLHKVFAGFEVIKETTRQQQYDIPREQGMVSLTTDVVTFVARKNSE